MKSSSSFDTKTQNGVEIPNRSQVVAIQIDIEQENKSFCLQFLNPAEVQLRQYIFR